MLIGTTAAPLYKVGRGAAGQQSVPSGLLCLDTLAGLGLACSLHGDACLAAKDLTNLHAVKPHLGLPSSLHDGPRALQTLIDSGLGEAVIGGGLDVDLRQPTYSVGLKASSLQARRVLSVQPAAQLSPQPTSPRPSLRGSFTCRGEWSRGAAPHASRCIQQLTWLPPCSPVRSSAVPLLTCREWPPSWSPQSTPMAYSFFLSSFFLSAPDLQGVEPGRCPEVFDLILTRLDELCNTLAG